MYSSSALSEAFRVLPHGLVDGGAVVEAGVAQRVHDGHGAPEPGINKRCLHIRTILGSYTTDSKLHIRFWRLEI